MICENNRTPKCASAVWVDEYDIWVCSRKDGKCEYTEEVLIPVEQHKLFTKEFSDGRKEYRYGPEWVAMQLFIEGGYDTPEEARRAWEEGR